MRQLVVIVAAGGDDLCPGHLIASELLVQRGQGQIPAKDGCHIASSDLKGCCQVGCLHQDLLLGHWKHTGKTATGGGVK